MLGCCAVNEFVGTSFLRPREILRQTSIVDSRYGQKRDTPLERLHNDKISSFVDDHSLMVGADDGFSDGAGLV